ncbi:MAG: hypothetical protein WA733_10930 [Methylocystis sp.]
MFDHYPIHDLIENQQKQLGLRRNELALRCGFKNLDKDLRRIDGVCHGDLDSPGAKMVLDNLAVALEVDKNVVEKAIRFTAEIIAKTERQGETAWDAAWRASFKSPPTLSVPRIVRLKSPSTT